MAETTITAIRTTPFCIPYAHEVRFSTGRLTHAEHVLVEVETAGGVVGVAEAIPRLMVYGETTVSIEHIIMTEISAAAIGLDVRDTAVLDMRLRHLVGNVTARSAVELAMFDAIGKSLGQSCHRLLGGYADTMTVTGSLGFGEVDTVRNEAAQLVADYGIRSFKVKVGMDIEKDVRIVRALRGDLPEALIYVDANLGYTARDALSFLRRTAEYDLAWIEEPCSIGDVLGRADVAARSPIPILGDESCTTVREVVTEVLARRCAMISVKPPRTGIRASIRIREFCAAVGAPLILGTQGESGIGTFISAAFAAADPATAVNPTELGYFLNLRGDLLAEPPVVKDGVLRVPDGPGFGFTLDAEQVARFRTDG
jgi:L-alanine-DL-glutamate epimerase-like enolase superfamily enzyme